MKAPKTGKILNCTDCGHDYWLTSIECLFYLSEGVEAPKRCRSCLRAAQRHASQEYTEPYTARRVGNTD